MSVERIMAAPVMAQVPASASASDNAWATGDSPAAKEHLRHREFRNQSAWLGLPVGAATGAATGVAISEAMRKIRGGKISPFYSRMSSNGTIGTLLGIAGAVTGIITGYSITHAKMQKHQDVPVGALVQTGEVKGLSPVKNDYVEGDTIGYVVGSDAEDSGIIRKYNVENTYPMNCRMTTSS